MISSIVQPFRYRFSTSLRNYSKSATAIPGLGVFQNFLGDSQKEKLQLNSAGLFQRILTASEEASKISTRTHLSRYHNLSSQESYQLVKVEDVNGRKVTGQHFAKYGEEGHQLTYFIANANIPTFIKEDLVPRVLRVPAVEALSSQDPLDWNLTFNTYATTKDRSAQLSGFDFHKDIPSNGEITMIYSLGVTSMFQIRLPEKPDQIHSFPLNSDSLLLLSKEARWDYEHRVVPVTLTTNHFLFKTQLESIRRISIVLGCSKLVT